MSVTGSRFVSQWFNLGNHGYEATITDGSPLDAAYFLSLMILGSIVLVQRRLQLAALVRQNGWLAAFMAFSLVSVLWSDFPVTAAKRWIKTLGHPIIALLILTDSDPDRAFRSVMRRCSFLLMPFSVLLIKYYPQFGRGFDAWSGTPINRGVGLTKNDLGYLCMIFGLFWIWDLLTCFRKLKGFQRVFDCGVRGLMLGTIVWLLMIADSATSLATLSLGTVVLLVVRLPFVDRRRIASYVFLAIAFAALIQLTFDPYTSIVEMLGRNSTLTDRTVVWGDAIALQPNVLLGAGFESFWLGSRLEILWEKWWWHPNQAHNGYVETYLNLGAIGLAILIGLLTFSLRRIGRAFFVLSEFGSLRLALFLAIVAFNYTEAAFKGVHFVWTVFFLIVIEYKLAPTNVRRRKPVGRIMLTGRQAVSAPGSVGPSIEPRASHRPRVR